MQGFLTNDVFCKKKHSLDFDASSFSFNNTFVGPPKMTLGPTNSGELLNVICQRHFRPIGGLNVLCFAGYAHKQC